MELVENGNILIGPGGNVANGAAGIAIRQRIMRQFELIQSEL